MPRSLAVCGITLSAVPAWNWQIEISADLIGSTLRDDDRLQLVDDLRADQHRSMRLMRPRRVRAAPLDLDNDAVGGRQHRARPDRELADRQARACCACRTPPRCRNAPSCRP